MLLPDRDQLTARYARLSEPELLSIARDYDNLTESSQSALRAEFDRRNLEPPIIDEVPQDERSLVTIRRYRDLSEAIIVRAFLESSGIPAYLQDENLVRLDWQISNFIGGIRLQVEAADQVAAVGLLDQPMPDPIPFDGPAPAAPTYTQPHCPHCQSTDIFFQGSSRGAALASLYLLSVPLPLGPKTWRCNNCDTVWEDVSDTTPQP